MAEPLVSIAHVPVVAGVNEYTTSGHVDDAHVPDVLLAMPEVVPVYVPPVAATVSVQAQVSPVHEHPSLVKPSQSSSHVLPHTSAGAQHVPQAQLGEQVWVPAAPQELLHACDPPGEHVPPPTQALQLPQAQAALHVRDCEPVLQKPQACDCDALRQHVPTPLSHSVSQSSSAPLHVSSGGMHGPHVQPTWHVREPVERHDVVHVPTAPGVQDPEPQPLQAPHAQLLEHVRDSVPPHAQARVSVVPTAHTPPPLQADHAPQPQEVLHARPCEPQKPQLWDCVAPRQHSPTPLSQPDTQSSSAPLQVSAGGMQVPLQLQLDVHCSVPLDPHAVAHEQIAPGAHDPAAQPLQEPHRQLDRQLRDSDPPQAQVRVSDAPGEHTPPPVHEPQALQAQEEPHVRVWVAHSPQLVVSTAPRQHVPTPSSHTASQSSSAPLHVSAGGVHAPHEHVAEQVCRPLDPPEVVQDWVAKGVQAPAGQPLHGPQVQEPPQVRDSLPPQVQARVSTAPAAHTPVPTHEPQAPQTQSVPQVRPCVPQKPQLCVAVAPRQHSQALSQPATQSSSARCTSPRAACTAPGAGARAELRAGRAAARGARSTTHARR